MQKFFLGVSAFVLTLLAAAAAQAQPLFGPLDLYGRPGLGGRPVAVPPVVAPVRPAVVSARPYYLDYGVRFAGGYYYPGRHHYHWAGRVWDVRFGRYHYWDPYLNCYFYWSPLYNCYLPCEVIWLP